MHMGLIWRSRKEESFNLIKSIINPREIVLPSMVGFYGSAVFASQKVNVFLTFKDEKVSLFFCQETYLIEKELVKY